MDEPTAVLAPQEIEAMMRTLRSMAADGRSIVFISHKLGEVLAIADRITVMRHGRVTAAGIPAAGATRTDLAKLMVGRAVFDVLDRAPIEPGPVVLDVRGVSAENDRALPALRDLSLQVRAGEILGIAAVAGNGQSELAEVITALRPCRGSIRVGDREVANRPTATAIKAGVAHVPEDRTGVGTSPNLSLADNLIMKRYTAPPIARGWFIDDEAARRMAQGLKDAYAIAAPSIDTEARLLSGGNLQRLIIAREIDTGPRLMVAVQPTRGLDVGAIETVHMTLLRRREAGTAILLISEELDELLALADRIAVLYEGRIVGMFPAETADIHEIGLLMTGGGSPGEPRRCRRRSRRQRGRRMTLVLEPRETVSRRFVWGVTFAALLVALLISGIVIWWVGGDPVRSFLHIVDSAFGSVGVISDTLVKATPLILTGLACSLAFRMRLWNIGAEGQFLLGAWGASAVVLFPLLPAGTPAIVVIPAMMVAGAVAGGLWGFIPGVLRARLGSPRSS
jgi:ABC-type multidrug transport system ATPase subunit